MHGGSAALGSLLREAWRQTRHARLLLRISMPTYVYPAYDSTEAVFVHFARAGAANLEVRAELRHLGAHGLQELPSIASHDVGGGALGRLPGLLRGGEGHAHSNLLRVLGSVNVHGPQVSEACERMTARREARSDASRGGPAETLWLRLQVGSLHAAAPPIVPELSQHQLPSRLRPAALRAPEYLKEFLLYRFPFSALNRAPFRPVRRNELFFFTICKASGKRISDLPRGALLNVHQSVTKNAKRSVSRIAQCHACHSKSGEAAIVLEKGRGSAKENGPGFADTPGRRLGSRFGSRRNCCCAALFRSQDTKRCRAQLADEAVRKAKEQR